MATELGATTGKSTPATSLLRPHYLLELSHPTLQCDQDHDCHHDHDHDCVPAWVETAIRNTPFVVVRRAPSRDGLIPVGVRGQTREKRFAAWVPQDSIARAITPPSLVEHYQHAATGGTAHSAMRTLAFLVQKWNAAGFIWGPAGSVGFELATGVATVNADSDLDIVIYADQRPAIEQLKSIMRDASDFDCSVDIQVETTSCGFSLSEYCREHPSQIILKTPNGPVLGADPWA